MVRCAFTDLPADSCAHCQGHADPEKQARAMRAELLAAAAP